MPDPISKSKVYVSLEGFAKQAHISKRKAKWLLENQALSCIDTGKRTHRFMIPQREIDQFLLAPAPRYPAGAFSSKCPPRQAPSPIAQLKPANLRSSLAVSWRKEPYALQVKDIAALTGYTCPTVRKWIYSGLLRSFLTPDGYIVAKRHLISYIAQYTIQHPNRLSDLHKALVSSLLQREHAESV